MTDWLSCQSRLIGVEVALVVLAAQETYPSSLKMIARPRIENLLDQQGAVEFFQHQAGIALLIQLF